MGRRSKILTTFESSAKTPVFIISLIFSITFVVLGFSLPNFETYVSNTFAWIVEYLGWTFILGGSAFVIVVIFLIISPIGEIRLGGDREKPEYSTMAWFSMLFSAGMGIGLLFWGVSEPINHYDWPAMGEGGTEAALHMAMQYSFFHWGVHPWAIYTIVAGSLAYFTYRKGLPMLLSSTLEPIIGVERINGKTGNLINIIAAISTLFGISTSLGFGVMQISAGMELTFGIPDGEMLWVSIIVVVTLMAILSTTSGISRGIKWLSQINLSVAGLLLLFVLILGPTLFILNLFTHSSGAYFQNLISMSFGLDAAGEGTEGWYDAWTIFYWAWWISWAPFVGTFIARVSRGRTIRSFAAGVMLVPTLLSMFWFSVFGGAALYNEHFTGGTILSDVMENEALGFFSMLETFPFSGVLVVIAMLSLTAFFVTSSDSGTYVIGMLTSQGNPNPPLLLRITWGTIEGAFAAVLVLAGGLQALQTSAVVGGFPFMIIMFLMVFALLKALFEEYNKQSLPSERTRIFAALSDLERERKIEGDVFNDTPLSDEELEEIEQKELEELEKEYRE